MKRGTRRPLALFMSVIMLLTGLPVSGEAFFFAEDSWTEETVEEGEVLWEEDDFTSSLPALEEAADPLSETAEPLSVPEGEDSLPEESSVSEDFFTAGPEELPFEGLVDEGPSLLDMETEEAEELAPFALLGEGWDPLPDPEYVEAPWDAEDALVSLPASYDSRKGYSSPVKNQRPFGMCWAFATMASMETWLLRAEDQLYDLSEEHLAYFMAHREDDPLHNTAEDKNDFITGGEFAYRYGGNQYLASLFLSTWSGFAQESLVPYPTNEAHTEVLPSEAKPEHAYQDVAYLTDTVFTKITESRVKILIYNYGAVGVSLNMDTTYYNATTHAYSYPSAGKVNHAVTLVGWDDSYPKENFRENSMVKRDGAYIAKNSWGTSWGEDGYFYISYDCLNLSNGTVVRGTTKPAYPNNYFYDGTSAWGFYASLKDGTSAAKLANVFQVKAGGGKCEALGEVVLVDVTDDSTYSISVYTNLTDVTDPTSGVLAVEPFTFHKEYAGIATVALPKEVVLLPGTYYSVVISNAGTKAISYLKDCPGLISGGTIQYVSHADPNQSLCYDALRKVWTDLAAENGCARIKAHTRTMEEAPSLSIAPESLSIYEGYEKSVSPLVNPEGALANFTYRSANPAVATVDEQGQVKAVAEGQTQVTAYAAGTSLSVSVPVTVEKIPSPGNPRFTNMTYAKIRLDWDAVSGAEEYVVYRQVKSGKFYPLARVKATKLYYADKAVLMGTTYSYYVTAVKTRDGERFESAPSAAISTKPANLAASKSVTLTVKKGYIKVKWTKVAGATGYIVYRTVGNGKRKKLHGLPTSTVKTWTDTTVKAGKIYTYEVRAYRKVNGKNYYSPYTASVKVTAK